MTVLKKIKHSLSFSPVPATILAVLLYAAIFISVLVTDDLPNIPPQEQWHSMNLTEAWADLHVIAARPHPYNSYENTHVHSYLLSRLNTTASAHPDTTTVLSDMSSSVSFASAPVGVYFEGTNILVKIEGTRSNASNAYAGGAVLFSAHYDSVSTAPGATDDGMGVATLVQLAQQLARERPERTAVFNINNGEEDYLHGAHAFMQHPWSNYTTTFMNLEGAAGGGRPLLFRATSLAPTRAFRVGHPHGNVISADAFARGVVRSGTDYSVYEKGLISSKKGEVTRPGMEGLDFAFYKGRSMYHTKYDALVYTEGGRKALWAMMDSTRAAGRALLSMQSETTESSERGKGGVYFDLFGHAMVVFSQKALLIADIVLLAAGPVIVLALLVANILKMRSPQSTSDGGPSRGFKLKALIVILIGWSKFWLSLALAILAEAGLVAGYVALNPFIVHSHPLLVLVAALSGAYLALALPLSFAHAKSLQQKLATMLETYLLTWVLLLGATVVGIAGFYWVSAWNAAVLVGAGVALVEALRRQQVEEEAQGEDDEGRLVRGVRYGVGAGVYEEGREGEVVETTESTPLLAERVAEGKSGEDEEEIGWWIVQMILLVPVPVILVSQVGLLIVGAMSQTLVDGSSVMDCL